MSQLEAKKQKLREFIQARSSTSFVPKEEWHFMDVSSDLDCPSCGDEVDCSGYVIKSKDQYQAVDIHLYGLHSICEPQAKFICLAANQAAIFAEEYLEALNLLQVLGKEIREENHRTVCERSMGCHCEENSAEEFLKRIAGKSEL